MVDSDLPPNPNPNPNPDNWPIHDNNDHLVFPPIDHENLQIVSPECHTPPSPPLPSSSPQSSPFDSRLRGWISIALHILRSKFSALRQRGPIWSFGLPAAALLMSCWIIIAAIRKKRTLVLNELRLINIINDKDRKIAKLLRQIAQMNELLIDRHKAMAEKVVK